MKVKAQGETGNQPSVTAWAGITTCQRRVEKELVGRAQRRWKHCRGGREEKRGQLFDDQATTDIGELMITNVGVLKDGVRSRRRKREEVIRKGRLHREVLFSCLWVFICTMRTGSPERRREGRHTGGVEVVRGWCTSPSFVSVLVRVTVDRRREERKLEAIVLLNRAESGNCVRVWAAPVETKSRLDENKRSKTKTTVWKIKSMQESSSLQGGENSE